MKKHFFCYCLVSLAALVFCSCTEDDFKRAIDGKITVSDSGLVGTTFYASYQGPDGDKIDGWYWSYESGSNANNGPGSPDSGVRYGSKFTAPVAGTLRASVQVSTFGYKGISSDRINVYKDPNVFSPITITTENVEVTSEGRLTITGFEEKYHKREVIAKTSEESAPGICAYKVANNKYEYHDGSLSEISTGLVIPDTVFSFDVDSSTYHVTLKLFIINNNRYEGYTGNDKDVTFEVRFGPNLFSGPKQGTVTVNFTNGVGSGAFVPDPQYEWP